LAKNFAFFAVKRLFNRKGRKVKNAKNAKEDNSINSETPPKYGNQKRWTKKLIYTKLSEILLQLGEKSG
jgi:hypothetical protein